MLKFTFIFLLLFIYSTTSQLITQTLYYFPGTGLQNSQVPNGVTPSTYINLNLKGQKASPGYPNADLNNFFITVLSSFQSNQKYDMMLAYDPYANVITDASSAEIITLSGTCAPNIYCPNTGYTNPLTQGGFHIKSGSGYWDNDNNGMVGTLVEIIGPALQNVIHDGTELLVLIGKNFRSGAVANFGGTTYTPETLTLERLEFRIPANSKNGQTLFTTSHAFDSTKIQLNLTPTIEKIEPNSYPAHGGTITITGTFLSTTRADSTAATVLIKIGNTITCLSPRNPPGSNTQLICDVPPANANLKDPLLVKVTIDAVPNPVSNTVYFTYLRPVLGQFSNVLNNLRYQMTNIGSDASKFSAKLGNDVYLGITVIGNEIRFDVSKGSLSGSTLTVVYYGLESLPLTVTLNPIIESISSTSIAGGLSTVTGMFMKPLSSIMIGSKPCADPVVKSDTSIQCTAPAGTGMKIPTVLTTTTLTSNTINFNYGPIVDSLDHQGDVKLIINGRHFDTDTMVTYPLGSYFIPTITGTSMLTITIPISSRNGPVLALSNSVTSAPVTLNLKPVVTSVSSAAPFGGLVTIKGRFLNTQKSDNSNTDMSVKIGSKTCSNPTKGVDNKELICTVPPAQGDYNLPVSITIDSVPNMGTVNFNYLKPQVLSHTSSDNYVTAVVQNVDTVPAQVSLSLNGNQIPSFELLGGDKIIFQLPNDTVSGLGLVVTSNGIPSDSYSLLLAPYLYSATPVPIEGGVTTIYGVFMNPNPTATIGSTQCENPVLNIANNYLTCTVAPGTGLDIFARVKTSLQSQNYALFDYGPVITGFIHNGGTTFQVQGKNFVTGSSIKVGSSSYSAVTSSPTLMSTSISLSSRNSPVSVTSNGIESNSEYINLQPKITSVSQVPVLGGELTIKGNFLNTLRSDSSPTTIQIKVGSNKICSNPLQSSSGNQEITCTLEGGNESDLPVQITIDGVPSADNILFNYYKPEVVSVSNSISTRLKVITKYVGNDHSKVVVKLGSQIYNDFQLANEIIEFDVQPDTPSGQSLIITVNGKESDGFTVLLSPVIHTIKPTPISGGVTSITGIFLNQVNQIDIGSFQCQEPITIYKTAVTCLVPAGTGLRHLTTLRTPTLSSSQDVRFNYGPKLNMISHTGGTQLTVGGENFDQDSQLLLETTLYPLAPSQITPSQITYTLPLTAMNSDNLLIVSNTIESNAFSLKLVPTIDSITSTNTTGGVVTISGTFLNTKREEGKTSTTVSVKIGSMTCTDPFSPEGDNTKLSCTIPAGTGDHSVSVTIDGILSTGNVIYTYGRPSISKVTQQDTKIIIDGFNFGIVKSDLLVKLNGVTIPCEITQENVQLQCQLFENSKSSEVVVSVLGLSSFAKPISLRPILSQVVPTQSINTGVTILGWFFGSIYNPEYSGLVGSTPCDSVSLHNETTIVCVPPTLSDSHTSPTTPNVQISINSKTSLNTLPFEYSTPSIDTIKQSKTTITISGNTLGNDDSKPKVTISGLDLSDACTLSKPQSEIICTLPLSVKNGDLIVDNYLGSAKHTKYLITPILESIRTRPTTSGGEVVFTAKLVNDLLQNTHTSVSLQIGDQNCQDVTAEQLGSEITVKCKVGPFITAESLSYLTLDGQNSESIPFHYLSPKSSGYTQNQLKLTIEGQSLGASHLDQIKLVTPTGLEYICQITVNHSTIECDFDQKIRNGPATLSRDGVQSEEPIKLELIPLPTSVSMAPVSGGIITITGQLLNLVDYQGNPTQVVIESNIGQCKNPKTIQDGTDITCSLPAGSHGVSNWLTVQIDGKLSSKVIFKAMDPVVEQSFGHNIYYGKGGKNMIIGSNFINVGLKVKINETIDCTNPVVVNSTWIECNFDASIKQTSEYGFYVSVECDKLVGGAETFIYSKEEENCLPEPDGTICSGNGVCNNGACDCENSFQGRFCNHTGNPQPPVGHKPDNVTFSDSFQSIFTHIREVDSFGKPVVTYPISSIKWNVSDSRDPNIIEAVGSLPNDPETTLEIWSKIYENHETVYFGGEEMKMTPSSMKYQIKLSGWKHKQSINKVELIYVLSSPQKIQDECEKQVESNTDIDNPNDLRFVTVQLHNRTFISRFSKRVIIDSRTTTTSTKLLPTHDAIFNEQYFLDRISLNETFDNLVVALSIPHFTKQAVLDPSFSYLINPNWSTKKSCSSPKKSLWWISLVSVGSVAMVGAGVGGFMYKRKLKVQKQFKTQMNKVLAAANTA
eukprot:gene3586-4467_t